MRLSVLDAQSIYDLFQSKRKKRKALIFSNVFYLFTLLPILLYSPFNSGVLSYHKDPQCELISEHKIVLINY